MKILNAEEIRKADAITLKKQKISSDALMERAALALFNWIQSRLWDAKTKIHIFCGIGNNGGDGLALARHLLENGYGVSVYVVNYGEKRSKDFLLNLNRLKERKLWPDVIDANSQFPEITANGVIVDAIFGIGLNRKPEDWVAQLITKINAEPAYTLAVDVPSGLFLDKPTQHAAIVKADNTLSFQIPKLVFFLPETAPYIGQWELLDIGLDPEYLATVDADYELMGRFEVLPLYRPRKKFSHKGNYGHSVLVGGSYGKIGAVILASRSCLLSGAGLVTSYIPKCGYITQQTAVPEAMVLTDTNTSHITQIKIPFQPTVIGIGMGMGTHKKTADAFAQFIKPTTRPLVLDADALNILAERKALLQVLPKESVLTPHPGELKRLIGNWANDFDKLDRIRAFSQQYDVIIVVKGAHTMVCYKQKIYVNTTGNPGMATAGSGDVLAGMITGLVSQEYAPLQAAILGVYLHGLAGDLVASYDGYEGVTAEKIGDTIGKAFLTLLRKPDSKNSSKE